MSAMGPASDPRSGSAARHLLVLLALVLVCYFGVKAFYGRFDFAAIGGREAAPPSSAGERVDVAQAGDASQEPDKEAITRRNLFLPAPRTSGGVTPGGQLQGGAALEPDLLLVGTVVDSAGGNRAVILDVEEKKQLLLREGEMVNGASISQISSGKVIISRAGRNERLDLAESARIQAVLVGSAGSPAAPALQINAVSPQGSSPEPDESAEEGQRIDLNRLDQADDRIIVKGRINRNI